MGYIKITQWENRIKQWMGVQLEQEWQASELSEYQCDQAASLFETILTQVYTKEAFWHLSELHGH